MRGFTKEEAGPPVARIRLWETWVVGNDLSRIVHAAAGAVTGSGPQASAVVVVGCDE